MANAVKIICCPQSASMRCMRVADLLAEELGETFPVLGRQAECNPADALVSKPDANAAIGKGSKAELGVTLNKHFTMLFGRLCSNARQKPSSCLGKLTNYFLYLAGRKITVEIDGNLGRFAVRAHGEKPSSDVNEFPKG